ncbi:MAG TPA: hypothetical protein VN626_01745 [Clostridia bacterium]|nr:hypothetical protein [Clostridia bacterium]
MGADDENDSLQFDDAYSNLERKIITEVLDEDMSVRWDRCKKIYEAQGIEAQFNTYQGVGHETLAEIDEDIVSFFTQVMNENK